MKSLRSPGPLSRRSRRPNLMISNSSMAVLGSVSPKVCMPEGANFYSMMMLYDGRAITRETDAKPAVPWLLWRSGQYLSQLAQGAGYFLEYLRRATAGRGADLLLAGH